MDQYSSHVRAYNDIHTPPGREQRPRNKTFGARRRTPPHTSHGRPLGHVVDVTDDFDRVSSDHAVRRDQSNYYRPTEHFHFGDNDDVVRPTRRPERHSPSPSRPKYRGQTKGSGTQIQVGASFLNDEASRLESYYMPPAKSDGFIKSLNRKPDNSRSTHPALKAASSSLEMASGPPAATSSPLEKTRGSPSRKSLFSSSQPTPKTTSPTVASAMPSTESIRNNTPSPRRTQSPSVNPRVKSTDPSAFYSTPKANDSVSNVQPSRKRRPLQQSQLTSADGKKKMKKGQSADEPISLASDSETETEANGTEEEEEKVDTLLRLKHWPLWIGQLHVIATICITHEQINISNIEHQGSEGFHGPKEIRLAISALKAFKIYRSPVQKRSLHAPDDADDFLDSRSFIACRPSFIEDKDMKELKNLFTGDKRDKSKTYLVIVFNTSASEGALRQAEENLGESYMFKPIPSREKAKKYLEAILEPPRKSPPRQMQLRRDTGPKRLDDYFDVEEEDETAYEVQLMYPLPPCSTDVVTLCKKDVSLLQPEQYLNDNIIDYHLKRLMLKEYGTHAGIQENVLFLSSHFYTRLVNGRGRSPRERLEDGHTNVTSWIAKCNFFDRSIIFLPINKDMHWSLAMILNPITAAVMRPDEEVDTPTCIAHLDSLGYHNSNIITRNLRHFLALEWERYYSSNFPGQAVPAYNKAQVVKTTVQVPRQENYFDCGVYTLKFAEVVLYYYQQLLIAQEQNGGVPKDVIDAKLAPLMPVDAFSAPDVDDMRRQIQSNLKADTSEYEQKLEEARSK